MLLELRRVADVRVGLQLGGDELELRVELGDAILREQPQQVEPEDGQLLRRLRQQPGAVSPDEPSDQQQPGAVSFDEMMRTIRRELVLPEEMPTSSALSSACDQLGLPSDGTLEQKAARCYEDISPVRAAAAAPASAAAPLAAKGSSR